MERVRPRIGSWFFMSFTLCLLGTGTCFAQAAEPQSVSLTEGTKLVFATPDAGQKRISERDAFVEHLGELEIQLRTESAEPVSKDQYLERLKAGVKPWKPEEIAMVESAAKELAEALEGYNIPLPEEVLLIRVSAEVEGNAPHCRGASIILPDGFFAGRDRPTRILAHELFHVLSSHNAKLRDQMYAVVHFTPCEVIPLPESWKPRRVTNPDAFLNQHVVRITVDGKETPVVPVLFTQSSEYQPGGLFANLDFRLMVLDEADGKFTPRLSEGQPLLLSMGQAPGYMQQIGRNTPYIIHPEEVLADNFALMVLDSNEVRDPWVIEGLKKVLTK